ncbi:MAG: hypothetical protein H0T76_15045 [Nannocystis sp.]|nr:hypothetical protein [Nannocystis sp.]MBA3547797.1 hypothetical protein [Nannocystis sp.]
MRNAVLIPLILVGIEAGAAEVKIRELRLSGGVTPETDEPEGTDRVGATSASISFDGDGALDYGPRGGITLYESFGSLGRYGGFMLGFGFSHSEQEGDAAHQSNFSPTPITYDGPIKRWVNVFDLHLGWAYALSDKLHVEVLPFVGYGSMRVQDTIAFGGGVSRDDHGTSDGPYWEGGLTLGLYYTFANGAQLGANGGWLVSHGRASIGYSDGSLVYEIDQSGPVGNITLGFRF